jgi:hypothetical protein
MSDYDVALGDTTSWALVDIDTQRLIPYTSTCKKRGLINSYQSMMIGAAFGKMQAPKPAFFPFRESRSREVPAAVREGLTPSRSRT